VGKALLIAIISKTCAIYAPALFCPSSRRICAPLRLGTGENKQRACLEEGEARDRRFFPDVDRGSDESFHRPRSRLDNVMLSSGSLVCSFRSFPSVSRIALIDFSYGSDVDYSMIVDTVQSPVGPSC